MRSGRSAPVFRLFVLPCLLLAACAAAGCGGKTRARQPLPKWEFGYWFWNGSSAAVRSAAGPVDVLFFQAGTIQHERYIRGQENWTAYDRFPEALPPAREYWLVFRCDEHAVPDLRTVKILARLAGELRAEASNRGMQIAGIQLDIDSPTRTLPEYAKYLRALRKELAPDFQISITALLDWFRGGTAIGDVVDAVDEFVPQFYDLRAGQSQIAAPIDGAKWGPVFNRFGKRFRIGVSTFGRARLESVESIPGWQSMVVIADVKPLDVAAHPSFALETLRTDAKEVVLRYRATRKTRIAYFDFEPGTTLEFVLSTPEAIREAVGQVRRMGEYCAGVVFFRWPAFNESMAVPPDVVLTSAGAASISPKTASLRVIDDTCAAVHCVDLYLLDTPALRPAAIRYVVASSTDLEYFLPDEKTPVRMTAPGRLELTLPAFGGQAYLHLGRAVTARPARYSLEERR